MSTIANTLAALFFSLPLLADTFVYQGVNADEQYIIKTAGTYDITAYGAVGGGAGGGDGGAAAEIGGEFTFSTPVVLDLFIGGGGATGLHGGGGGAGRLWPWTTLPTPVTPARCCSWRAEEEAPATSAKA